MKIRLATRDDLPTLVKLVGFATAEIERKFGTPRVAAHMKCIEYGINAGDAVVVAEQNGDIVGWCAWVALPETPEGYVSGLGTWTFEPYRHEHVARDMRKFAAEHCRKRGHKFVTGIAAVGNDAGLKSCLAMGFKVTGYEVALDLAEV